MLKFALRYKRQIWERSEWFSLAEGLAWVVCFHMSCVIKKRSYWNFSKTPHNNRTPPASGHCSCPCRDQMMEKLCLLGANQTFSTTRKPRAISISNISKRSRFVPTYKASGLWFILILETLLSDIFRICDWLIY